MNKHKHLDYIQTTIIRMSNHSFVIKGWSITLIVALLAFLIKENSRQPFFTISYAVVVLFWLLDGFFLATEKRFRKLYDKVRVQNEQDIDFSMNPYFENGDQSYKNVYVKWAKAMFTKTLIPFYMFLLISIFIIQIQQIF